MKECYQKDLETMLDFIEQQHPNLYHNITKEELLSFTKQTCSSYKNMDDYDFFYVVESMLAKINDPHTRSYFPGWDVFPLKFRILEGKVYIVITSSEYKSCLGQEVTAINGVDIDTILSELKPTISFSTEGWLEYMLENALRDSIQLRSLPSIPSQVEEIVYTLRDTQQESNVSFTCDLPYEKIELKPPDYTFLVDSDQGIMTIVYNQCMESKENQMVDFVEEVKEYASTYGIVDFIVDIRENTGGNSSIIEPLIAYLKTANQVVTLVDKAVFSSGRFLLPI